MRVAVIMYFMSKQLYTSCFPFRLYEVTTPGTKPIGTRSARSIETVSALSLIHI